MNNAANWFEIYTADFDRAKAFYSAVFECMLTDMPVSNERHPEMRYATFPQSDGRPGAGGALVKLNAATPGIGGSLIYFGVKDIDAASERVEKAGGKILRSKQDLGSFGFIAIIQDSEGNMIGLRSVR